MDMAIYREWFLRRIEIADEIVDKHGKGGEADAEILLCCVLSALAAKMWPVYWTPKVGHKNWVS